MILHGVPGELRTTSALPIYGEHIMALGHFLIPIEIAPRPKFNADFTALLMQYNN